MPKDFLKYSVFLLVLLMFGCAKRGTITGGLKDTIAPKMVSSFPKNYATNFDGKEIKINFNEYIKLKDINKQLIISPPSKRQPEILPYTASKTITIKIKDTLLPNTTYSFNFGKSIQDNNEGNPFEQFKYVFSTGNYIDSLSFGAKIKDAKEKKVDNFVSIMLYDANEKYTDSVIYKQLPRYITNTLDSLKIVKFENIKEGRYRLIALKDLNGNNKFDPKAEKIGFHNEFITLPNETVYELSLFKEEPDFKALKATQVSANRCIVGYEGNAKDVKIAVKKNAQNLPFLVTQLPKKDSLQVWFKAQKGDSLSIDVSKSKFQKTFSLKVKEQKKDTLGFSSEQVGKINFRDDFAIKCNVPLIRWDVSKMKLINKDSADVKFTNVYDEFNQEFKFIFNKEPLEKYNLKVLPDAFTDYYDRKNDTLSYDFFTNDISDYGNLRLKLENVKRFPVIVQLTDSDGKVLISQYSEKETSLTFDLIDPAKYTIRVIYDDDKNKQWTPGNFLQQRQSEEIIYLNKEIDLRPNWDWEEVFDLKATN